MSLSRRDRQLCLVMGVNRCAGLSIAAALRQLPCRSLLNEYTEIMDYIVTKVDIYRNREATEKSPRGCLRFAGFTERRQQMMLAQMMLSPRRGRRLHRDILQDIIYYLHKIFKAFFGDPYGVGGSLPIQEYYRRRRNRNRMA